MCHMERKVMGNIVGSSRIRDCLRPLVRGLTDAIAQSNSLRNSLRALSVKGYVSDWIWKRILVEGAFEVDLSPDHRFIYYCTYGDILGQLLYWRGWKHSPEGIEISFFFELAKRARCVIDVGANTGLYSLIACASNSYSEVVAFEPVSFVRKNLIHNLAINGWSDRCRVMEEAVADFVGPFQLCVENRTWGYPLPRSYDASFNVEIISYMSSLSPQGFRGRGGTLVPVMVTTLDEACQGRQDIDLVKIDVEGFEHLTLRGSQRILGTSKPAVMLEAHYDSPLEEISTILKDFGYSVFDFTEEGLLPLNEIAPDTSRHFRNVLCLVRDDHFSQLGLSGP